MYSSNFELAQVEYSRLLRKNKAFRELVQLIEVCKLCYMHTYAQQHIHTRACTRTQHTHNTHTHTAPTQYNTIHSNTCNTHTQHTFWKDYAFFIFFIPLDQSSVYGDATIKLHVVTNPEDTTLQAITSR